MIVPRSHVILFFALAVAGAWADLWTKGAVFGIGAGQGVFFAALSAVAGAGICVWLFWFGAAESRWLTVALGLVMGGIIGNLYDRLGMWWQPGYDPSWKSGVRDWILWQASERWKWPNFNIADSLLVVGAGMLLYQSFVMTDGASGEGAGATVGSDSAEKIGSAEGSAANGRESQNETR